MKTSNNNEKHELTICFKSGKEYRFRCEKYKVEHDEGLLTRVYFTGATGVFPIYFRLEEIESIAVTRKEENG